MGISYFLFLFNAVTFLPVSFIIILCLLYDLVLCLLSSPIAGSITFMLLFLAETIAAGILAVLCNLARTAVVLFSDTVPQESTDTSPAHATDINPDSHYPLASHSLPPAPPSSASTLDVESSDGSDAIKPAPCARQRAQKPATPLEAPLLTRELHTFVPSQMAEGKLAENGASYVTPDGHAPAAPTEPGSTSMNASGRRAIISGILGSRVTVTVPASGDDRPQSVHTAAIPTPHTYRFTANVLLSGRAAPSIRMIRRAGGTLSSPKSHQWTPEAKRSEAMEQAGYYSSTTHALPVWGMAEFPVPAAAAAHRALEGEWDDAAHILRSVSTRSFDANKDDAGCLHEYFAVTATFLEEYFLATEVFSSDSDSSHVEARHAHRKAATVAMGALIAAIDIMHQFPSHKHVNLVVQAAEVARQATLDATRAEALGKAGLQVISVNDLGVRLAAVNNGKFLVMLLARGAVYGGERQKRQWAGQVLYPGRVKSVWRSLGVVQTAMRLRRVHCGHSVVFSRAEREYREIFS